MSDCIEFVFNIGMETSMFLRDATLNQVIKDQALTIPTLEGDMKASFGDWIIRGVNGEHYPCKPDIFDKTYEPADGVLA
ncbi:MAG TPA: hypothetical protein PLN30_00445 [Ferruginibacter sp.]|nr:hypothetical protein [Ferruginibacter sp.]